MSTQPRPASNDISAELLSALAARTSYRVPPGRYTLDSSASIGPDCAVFGDGPELCRITAKEGAAPILTVGDAAHPNYRSGIRGLTLDGIGVAFRRHGNGVGARDLFLRGAHTGLVVNGPGDRSVFESVEARDCTDVGILYMTALATRTNHGVVFRDDHVSGCGTGMHIWAESETTVRTANNVATILDHCTLQGNSVWQLLVSGYVTSLTILHGHIEGGGDRSADGIVFSTSGKWSPSGVRIDGGTQINACKVGIDARACKLLILGQVYFSQNEIDILASRATRIVWLHGEQWRPNNLKVVIE